MLSLPVQVQYPSVNVTIDNFEPDTTVTFEAQVVYVDTTMAITFKGAVQTFEARTLGEGTPNAHCILSMRTIFCY